MTVYDRNGVSFIRTYHDSGIFSFLSELRRQGVYPECRTQIPCNQQVPQQGPCGQVGLRTHYSDLSRGEAVTPAAFAPVQSALSIFATMVPLAATMSSSLSELSEQDTEANEYSIRFATTLVILLLFLMIPSYRLLKRESVNPTGIIIKSQINLSLASDLQCVIILNNSGTLS